MAADDRSSEEIDEFLDSMKKCFDDVDQALADENASIPLDYLESRLEDHFQIVNAIAIAIQDNASSDLNQTVQDLQSFSQNLLQEIHTTKVRIIFLLSWKTCSCWPPYLHNHVHMAGKLTLNFM